MLLLADTFEMRNRLLYLSLVKPRQTAEEALKIGELFFM
jgi:hypothetical protein